MRTARLRDLEIWHVFGTATCISPLMAAYSRTSVDRQDHEGFTFPQVTRPHLWFQRVGRLGLKPRTGGL